MTRHSQLFMEIHEKGHSFRNYKWRWDRLMFLKPRIYKQVMFITKEVNRVSTSKWPCVEKYYQTECMDQFMEHTLNCILPWRCKQVSI